MADDIRLVIGVDNKGVLSAIKSTETLESKVKKLSATYERGGIGYTRYRKGLEDLSKAYKKGEKELRDYANATRAAERANKAAKAAAKAEAQAVRDYAKARREATEANRRYDAEAKKAAQTARTQATANRRLRMEFKEGYAANVQLRAAQMRLNQARRQGIITDEQYNAQLGTLARTTQLASRRMNSSGMAMQQVGYQAGDFLVQIQSGTNAMVAFGQQATQLVGILPMFNSFMGLSGNALVALSAGLGITIPLLTAIGAALMRTSGASETLKESLDKLEETNDNLREFGKGFGKDLVGDIEAVRESFGDLVADVYAAKLGQVQDKLAGAFGRGYFSESFAASYTAIKPSDLRASDQSQLNRQAQQELEIQQQINSIIGQTVTSKGQLNELFNEAYTTLLNSDNISEEGLKRLREIAIANGIVLGIERDRVEAGKALSEANEKSAQAAQEAFDRLQEQKSMMSRASGDERIAIEQEVTAALIEAQDAYLKAIEEAHEAGTGLASLDLKSPFESALPAARLLAHDMNIALTDALSLINAATSDNGPVLGGRGTSAGAGSTASDRLMMSLGGEFTPYREKQGRDKKTPAQLAQEAVEKLQQQLDVQRDIVHMTEAEAHVRQALGEHYAKVNPETITGLEQQYEATKKLVEVQKLQETLATKIGQSFANAFTAMVDGTMSAKDAFKNMAREIIKQLWEIFVVQQIVNAAKMAFGVPFADGGAFSGGSQIQAYANGGVVNSPTYFPMNGGKTGLMGEAGPEAIMPLKRGKNGKLGVQMEGGGGDTINVVQNFNMQANGDESVKRIIAQAAPKIAQMTKSSLLDDRRRGGATKAAFG